MYVRSRDSLEVVHKVRVKSRITPQCIGQGYRLDHFNAKINYVMHCWIISTNKLNLLSYFLQKKTINKMHSANIEKKIVWVFVYYNNAQRNSVLNINMAILKALCFH